MATAVTQASEQLEFLPCVTGPAERRQDCVLLIEDCEDAMLLVQYALSEFGNGRYLLAWANNLGDGLERLSKGGVDIVLLDLGLPDHSGPASYAWLRQVNPKVPVVVVTGETSPETEMSVLASGAEDYLIKNEISGALLLQAIQAALSANKQPRDWRTKIEKFPPRFRKKFERH